MTDDHHSHGILLLLAFIHLRQQPSVPTNLSLRFSMPCTQSEEPSAEALGHRYLRITNWCGPKSSFTNRVPSNAVCTGTSPVPPWRNVIFDGSGCKTVSTTTRSCRVAFETF